MDNRYREFRETVIEDGKLLDRFYVLKDAHGNDIKDGLHQQILCSNGQKLKEGTYKNGELHGKAIVWYENGQKMVELNYKNGALDGQITAWDENGKVVMSVRYGNDELLSDNKYPQVICFPIMYRAV